MGSNHGDLALQTRTTVDRIADKMSYERRAGDEMINPYSRSLLKYAKSNMEETMRGDSMQGSLAMNLFKEATSARGVG